MSTEKCTNLLGTMTDGLSQRTDIPCSWTGRMDTAKKSSVSHWLRIHRNPNQNLKRLIFTFVFVLHIFGFGEPLHVIYF